MNIPKIGTMSFKGTMHTPKTEEWKKVKKDESVSPALSSLNNFVGKKLDAWVKVTLGVESNGNISVVAKNDKRKERKLEASYTTQDFAENISSLQKRLLNVNS